MRVVGRRVNAPGDVVLAASGWEGNGGVSDDYGSGPGAKAPHRWVRKIKYDGVDMTHLTRG